MKNNTLMICALVIVIAIMSGAFLVYNHGTVSDKCAACACNDSQSVPVYNESFNGTTITLHKGDRLNISLQENPTTGFTWDITSTQGINVLASQFIPGQSGLIGAPGTHVWTLEASRNGTQQFKAVLRRGFEPLTGSENSYHLTMQVIE
ncbi:MAG TPA: protease inhibitor I42 family protein [Methanocella sp.]